MIEKVKIALKNCYGIDELEHTFDFSSNNKPILIYAPNGVMKTSLAKSMHKYAENSKPEDIFFPERESKLTVLNEVDNPLEREAIFVIDSIDEKYQSDRISTLLASEDLKKEYDVIFGSISEKKEKLLKMLRVPSGLTKDDIDLAIATAFKVPKEEVLIALARLEREVRDGAHSDFSRLKYKRLFSDKILGFLQKPNIKALISDYTKVYEQILDKSIYFKKGIFNHSNAETIAKNLKSNGWFKGGHSVNLVSKNGRNEISTEEDLIDAIEAEKQKILTDTKLAEMFKKVDDTLSTAELRNFRDYLLENPFVVAELSDIDAFKQRVWISYLIKINDQYFDLIKEYDNSKNKIKEIIGKAEKQQTQWESVIAKFNDRFQVPFTVHVENKGDSVLNLSAPQIAFYVKDRMGGDARKTERDTLDMGLSNGERRALYILNIIFEIEARHKANIETLIILDDIADSFDYKNKYAIVEYLSDISALKDFHLIILTHNYDFYRTVGSRLSIHKLNKLICNRLNGALQLIPDKISNNPFKDWKGKLNNPEFLVASIPFVRNLAEYVGNTTAFEKLTSLLHIKAQTHKLDTKELYRIYCSVLADDKFVDFSNLNGFIFNHIMTVSNKICDSEDDNMTLEQKIALSVGIRLTAEEVLINEINDKTYVNSLTKNQTASLIRKYEELERCNDKTLRTVKRVALMTPENIHLNSFMFEPILDMSGHHLKSLFKEIKICLDCSVKSL